MLITLNQLEVWSACEEGYDRVVAVVGENYDKEKPIKLFDLVDGCEVSDIFWAFEEIDLTEEQERGLRLMACDFAERVLPIFEKERPDDDRPRLAIQAARDFASGKISRDELDAAEAAAGAAAADAEGPASRGGPPRRRRPSTRPSTRRRTRRRTRPEWTTCRAASSCASRRGGC